MLMLLMQPLQSWVPCRMPSSGEKDLLSKEIESYRRMIRYLEEQILLAQKRLGKNPPHREA